MAEDNPGGVGARSDRFAATEWRLIAAAAHDDASGRDALARVCQRYWHPLYAYVRRHGYSVTDAQDLTQAFFERLLAKHGLEGANPGRGKFRSFLLSAMRHFLANESERTATQRRGGGVQFVPVDAALTERRYGLQFASDATPDKLFERAWAMTVLERVLSRLQAEQEKAGKLEVFQLMKPSVLGERAVPYRELAAQASTTEDAVKMAIHRLRRRYGELLREEIAQTVADPAEIQGEILHLFEVLRG